MPNPHPGAQQMMRHPNYLADVPVMGNVLANMPGEEFKDVLYDIFGDYPRKNVLPYMYQFRLTTAEATALAALGTARATIKVSADASFVARYITGASTGDYTVFLRTDSSDRQLMDDPVHSATVVGSGERPFILPKPLLMAPNTTVTFTLQDLSNAVNEVYVTLCGFKVYRRQFAMAG